MEFDYLVHHAIKNVWCTPRQDQQVIIKPAKLTPKHGVSKSAKLMWRYIPTPDQTSRWHIYQIGGTHPIAFNLFAKCYSWIKISEACEKQSLLADLYITSGYKIPVSDSYYAYSADHNLIIAVRANPKMPYDLNLHDLYLRVYSNAFYGSPRANNIGTPKVKIDGRTIEANTDRSVLKSFYQSCSGLPGHAWIYINAVLYESWVDALMPIGSYVEVVYDASVRDIIKLKIGDMDTFESTLDKKKKYLLHYDDADPKQIDYQDDIDVYITRNHQAAGYQGLFYNKNNEDAMRNLTHRDYSIVATYLRRYADTYELMAIPRSFIEPEDLYAIMFIRNSGYQRDLVFVNSRIHELYKMKDLDVRRAMTGIDATVDVWKAHNLEADAYPEVMRSQCCDITNELVEKAYGYNSISKILGDTPSKPFDHNGEMSVEVPYKLQYGCTAYEYDNSGLLIGYHQHYVGRYYVVKNPATTYVELIAGLGSPFIDEHKGIKQATLKDNYSYRVFQCTAVGGIPDNKWIDVTGSDKYTFEKVNGTYDFNWTDTSVTAYPMVRSDKRFLARDYEISLTDGALSFSLQQKVNTPDGIKDQVMQVPMGQIDIFLNGRSLIRDLDYFVVFPKVFIVNKKYLKRPINSEKQNVHIRFTGFASKQFELIDEGNRGFIEHGLLSNDSKYNIRDDKVLRIVVDGRLYTRDELQFSEFTSGVSVTNASNGLPYLVKDILVPVSSHTTTDTYELRELSKVVDKAVSDYLTLKIPQPERNAPSAIPYKHQLYSPFCNRLIMDLKYNRLQLPVQDTGYTRQQVLEICRPYEWLLKFDPSQNSRAQDGRYVLIHPHGYDSVIDLNKREYQFMNQVVILYCGEWVEMSQMVRMVE